jgi:hypothetical protein
MLVERVRLGAVFLRGAELGGSLLGHRAGNEELFARRELVITPGATEGCLVKVRPRDLPPKAILLPFGAIGLARCSHKLGQG